MSNSTPQNLTRSFLHWEAYWPGLEFTYEDLHYQHDGERIFFYGTGHSVVQKVDKDDQETRYELRLPWERVRRIIDLLVAEDLLALESDYASSYGEFRATIQVVTESGMWKLVGKYAGESSPRFEALQAEFFAIRDEALKLQPTFQGTHESNYKPKQGWARTAFHLRRWLFRWRFWHYTDLLRPIGEALFIAIALWPMWLYLAVMATIAFFFVRIDPNVTYGFGPAIVHGVFGIPNLALMPFTDHVATAPKNTGITYNVGFMIGLCVIPWLVRQALEILLLGVKEWARR